MRPLLPFVALAVACGSNKSDADTETDPTVPILTTSTDTAETTGDSDNTFGSAAPIVFDVDLDGVIEPAGDIDWYSLTIDEPTWVRVDTVTVGDRVDNLDTVIRVWSPSGESYALMDNYATGTVGTFDTVLYAYLDSPGAWGITVEDKTTFYTDLFTAADWRGGRQFTYTVGVSVFDGLTSEPDSLADPDVLLTFDDGASIFAVGVNLETPGDADYLTVTTALSGEPLEVWGSSGNVGSTMTPKVRLYGADQTLLSEKSDVGRDGFLSYFDPPAGDYTVEITDEEAQGGPSTWFVAYVRTYDADFSSLFFGSTEYYAEYEPSDLEEEALYPPTVSTPIDDLFYDVAAVEGTISLAGDIDWFGISADSAADQVSVRCFTEEFGSLLDLKVTVRVDGVDLAAETDVSSNYYYILDLPVGGPTSVSVKIEGEDGMGSPAAYYRCRILVADFDIPQG